MIKLTRLDGSQMHLNPDQIETIEENPDTHITLLNGNRYLVLEPARIIIDKIVNYKARIRRRSLPGVARKYLRNRDVDNYRPVCKL